MGICTNFYIFLDMTTLIKSMTVEQLEESPVFDASVTVISPKQQPRKTAGGKVIVSSCRGCLWKQSGWPTIGSDFSYIFLAAWILALKLQHPIFMVYPWYSYIYIQYLYIVSHYFYIETIRTIQYFYSFPNKAMTCWAMNGDFLDGISVGVHVWTHEIDVGILGSAHGSEGFTKGRTPKWMVYMGKSYSGGWFEPLWKILVNWDDYSQYMGK